MSLFTDERGNVSSARVSFWVALLFTLLLIALDSTVPWVDVPGAAYALLGSICTGVLAWAAGPRIAQYVGPQIAGVAAGIASAARGARQRTPEDIEP